MGCTLHAPPPPLTLPIAAAAGAGAGAGAGVCRVMSCKAALLSKAPAEAVPPATEVVGSCAVTRYTLCTAQSVDSKLEGVEVVVAAAEAVGRAARALPLPAEAEAETEAEAEEWHVQPRCAQNRSHTRHSNPHRPAPPPPSPTTNLVTTT